MIFVPASGAADADYSIGPTDIAHGGGAAEPPPKDHPLFGLENVVLTPHLGASTDEAQTAVSVDACKAIVAYLPGDELDALLRDRVQLRDAQFARTPPAAVSVQMRAHGEPFAGRLEGDTVVFATPQQRVAPGQVVALYDGDVMLGGGIAAG